MAGNGLESESAHPGELLVTLYNPVARLRDIRLIFENLADVQQKLIGEETEVDEAAAFIKGLNLSSFFDNALESHLESDVQRREPSWESLATIGYASLLIASRDGLMAEEARDWADGPVAQAFIGTEIHVSPADNRPRGSSGATVNCEGAAAALVHSNWISGHITGISPEESGTILLEGGDISTLISTVDNPYGEPYVRSYEGGKVTNVFDEPDYRNLIPNVAVRAGARVTS